MSQPEHETTPTDEAGATEAEAAPSAPAAAPVYKLEQYPESIAVVRFGPGTSIPDWAESSSVFAVVATSTETSVICAARNVPKKARSRKPFNGFMLSLESATALEGNHTGVLVSLLTPLAEAGISAEVVTTFDTLWILVHKNHHEDAAKAWRRQGHTVVPATPV